MAGVRDNDSNPCRCADCCVGFEVDEVGFVSRGNISVQASALAPDAHATATSYSSGTLTLNDASGFPNEGSAVVRGGRNGRSCAISWTGKSGNALTGVSGVFGISISAGATVSYRNQGFDLADYDGTARLSATSDNPDNPAPELDPDTISFSDGLGSADVQILGTVAGDIVNLTVSDPSPGTPGRCKGAAEFVCPEFPEAHFVVTLPAIVSDYSTDFSMTVTCFDDDGAIDASYSPVGSVTIAIDNSASLLVTTIPSATWSDGVATLTNQITNATAKPQDYTISVTDSNAELTGSAKITVPVESGTVTSFTTEDDGFYSYTTEQPSWSYDSEREPPYSPNDTDPIAYTTWNSIRADLHSGTLSGRSSAAYAILDQYGYPSMMGRRYCAHVTATIPTTYRDTVTSASLGLSGCVLEGCNTGSQDLEVVPSFFAALGVKLSEDELITSADDWFDLEEDHMVSASRLNSGYARNTGWDAEMAFNDQGNVSYYLPIDPAVIRNMSGYTLHIYLWFMELERPYRGINYSYGRWRDYGADTGRGILAGARPLELVLSK